MREREPDKIAHRIGCGVTGVTGRAQLRDNCAGGGKVSGVPILIADVSLLPPSHSSTLVAKPRHTIKPPPILQSTVTCDLVAIINPCVFNPGFIPSNQVVIRVRHHLTVLVGLDRGRGVIEALGPMNCLDLGPGFLARLDRLSRPVATPAIRNHVDHVSRITRR